MIASTIRRRVVEFCALLRANGFSIGMAEAIDCVSALKYIDILDRKAFRQALMCTLVKKADQIPLFLYLFESFFSNPNKENPQIPLLNQGTTSSSGGGYTPSTLLQRSQISAQNWFKAYSPNHLESERRITLEGVKHRYVLRRNIRTLERAYPKLGGRRRRPSVKGEVDLRSTLRSSLRGSGDLRSLRWSERKPAKNRLLVLVDVSGSMDSATQSLLELVYVASNVTHTSSVFCFSTTIRRVDNLIRGKTPQEAARIIGSQLSIWGSGTRIGDSLSSLLSEFSHLLDPSTLVVIISDGWDLGNVVGLRESISEIRARVGGILWFNPLADTEGYQPLTAGISTVLPYLDALAGLSCLFEPRGVMRLLAKIRASGGV